MKLCRRGASIPWF